MTLSRARIKRLEHLLTPPRKTHIFVVETGKRPTARELAQVRPGDTVILHEIPEGYFAGPQSGAQVMEYGRTGLVPLRQYGVDVSKV